MNHIAASPVSERGNTLRPITSKSKSGLPTQQKEEDSSFGVIVRLFEASGFLTLAKCIKCVYVLVVYVVSNGIGDEFTCLH